MITVKHRRGTPEMWDAIDPIIPDGELAITRKDSGDEIRIGNGQSSYSELLPINGRRTLNFDEYVHVELRDGDEVQCGLIESLYLTLERGRKMFFSAIFSFDCYNEFMPVTINCDESILFSGDDVYEGVFEPSPDMHYTFLFWYDGYMNCHVRGAYVG